MSIIVVLLLFKIVYSEKSKISENYFIVLPGNISPWDEFVFFRVVLYKTALKHIFNTLHYHLARTPIFDFNVFIISSSSK